MTKNLAVRLLTLVATILLTQPAGAVKLEEKIPLSPRVRIGTLPNGLTYYIQKNALPAKKVELRLLVKAGSVLEDDDQRGLAHVAEHLAFNGSTHFKGNELVSFLQSIGVKYGADLNASTGFDVTEYILPIPTDKKENLEAGFTVLEDWAGGVSFEHAAIDKERGIVLEESRLSKGAGDRIGKVVYPKILAGSKYAERLPIGKDDIIANFKYEALTRFYADWYRPDLMAVIVVGDVEPEAAEAMVKAHFGQLKNPLNERPLPPAVLPARSSTEAVVVTDKEMPINLLAIMYSRQPEVPELSWGDYRTRLVARLFNNLIAQRLAELSQSPNPPFIGGGSQQFTFIRGFREFQSSAAVGKAGPVAAINALVRENERVAAQGFTPAELERSKKAMLRTLERSNNEREKTESRVLVAEFARNFLQQEAIPGVENELRAMQELLPSVTLAEISALAKKLVTGNGNRLVIYEGSGTGDYVPLTSAQLLDTLAAASKAPLVAYEEKVVAGTLMEQAPQGGKLLSERQLPALGITELTLANGVKVMLKPTDFKNDQVLMTGQRHGGRSLFGDADYYSAQQAARLVNEMGVANFSGLDLRKVLAGKTASATPYINELGEGINGQSGTADVEAMLQLTSLYLTQPRKDEALFKTMMDRQRDASRNALANPQTMFVDLRLKYLYADDPHRPAVAKPEDFDQVSLDRVMAIYRQRFASVKGFTFNLIGSFEVEKIKPLVIAYLGSLPGQDIVAGFKDVIPRPVRGVLKNEVFLGAEQKSLAIIDFTGEAPYSPEANMRFTMMLEVLKIKLVEALREQLGAVYTVQVGGALGKQPYEHYSINITIPSAPENVERLIAATLAEIQRLKDAGALPTDLAKVKENMLKSHREAVKTNNYWARNLQNAIDLDLDPALLLGYETRAEAVSSADIKDAVTRYFDLANYVQVVLYPAKK